MGMQVLAGANRCEIETCRMRYRRQEVLRQCSYQANTRIALVCTLPRLESRRGDDDDRRRRREIMSHSGAGSALSHIRFSVAPAWNSRGWNYRRRLAPAMYGGQEIKCCPVTLFPTKKKRNRMTMVVVIEPPYFSHIGYSIEMREFNNIWTIKCR